MSLTKAPKPKGYEMFGPEPKFPYVPYDEFKARLVRVRSLMAAEKIDLLMIWSRQNCVYFTGYTSCHWANTSIQPLVALIPTDSDPVLICGEFFRWTVESQCWIRDIRCQSVCHETKAERALPREVADTVKEMGYGKASIALEMGGLGCMWIPRPLNDIQLLMSELSEAKFVDGDRVIWGCRMIKSPLEVDWLTRAAATHRKGVAAVVEDYRPGMTEQDVGKILWRSFSENGADILLDGHIACGMEKEGMFDTGFHFDGVKINTGDYLWLDVCMAYRGYWADMGRVLNVGPPSDDFVQKQEAAWTVWEAGFKTVKPGIKAKEVWYAVTEAYKEHDLASPEVTGHGIGLDIHEPPVLSATEETVLQPGMTLELETGVLTGFRRDGGGGGQHVENLVVVTDKGAESVIGLPRAIMRTRCPLG